MAVFIDRPQKWPGRLSARLGSSAHLITDGPPEELAAFAARIGLRPAWLQAAGTYKEHYDVFEARRARALAAGAVPVDRKAFVAILRKKKACSSG